ncbi:MAG: hypothetical protein IT176_14565 [Acidobacteria bacterium]|nr:hypothetical protein [Acidobacteriota bacterium]
MTSAPLARMRIVVRVDAGPRVGLGHLRRCLALASAPAFLDASVCFLVNDEPSALGRVERAGFLALPVPDGDSGDAVLRALGDAGPRAAVVDWRGADRRYLDRLRDAGAVVVSIDDLASTAFPSHLVVNSNSFARELTFRSTAGDTRFLLGPPYLMLGPSFRDVPPPSIRPEVRSLLVTLGGADAAGLTPAVLDCLVRRAGDSNLTVTAVVGPFTPGGAIRALAARCPGRIRLLDAPEDLCDEMLRADLAVSAGGQTLYELARVGCPAIAIEVSADQRDQIRTLAAAGAVRPVDPGPSLDDLARAVGDLRLDVRLRRAMSAAGRALVDGQGAERVALEIASALEASRIAARVASP